MKQAEAVHDSEFTPEQWKRIDQVIGRYKKKPGSLIPALEEIQELFPVTLPTLKRWHKEGRWEEKKRQALVSPRWLGEALRGVLREKTGKIIATGDMKPQE